jgi:MFS family permease
VQRRTLGTLVAAQALGGLGITIGLAVASILAVQISGSTMLGGLTQTMQVLGAAVASYLLAHLMGRRGRRPGLLLGYLLGAAGAGLCVVAGVARSFPVLLVGAALLGATTAANNQSRFAATDLARPERRARALSLVVWATAIGAVAGPNLTGVAGKLARQLGLPGATGAFLLGFVGIACAAVVIVLFLRPDPLLVARQAALAGRLGDRLGERPGDGDRARAGTSWSRVIEVVRTRPAVAAGIAALALAHAVMIAVMVMAPLHMHDGGARLEVIGIVISLHVFGMFFFAPVVGWGADRFGRAPMLVVGAAVLFVALFLAGTSPMGASWRIGAGLFLLGLGWSLCQVAASTLVSESTPLDARTDVQGAADLVMGVAAAAAGALAGLVVGSLGYGALNLFAGVLVAGVATAAELARRAAAGHAQTLEL